MVHFGVDLPKRRSRLALFGLVAIVAISVTGALRYYLRSPSNESERLAKLAKIVGPHRLARARLTGGFAYAPCKNDSSDSQLVRGLACDGPPASSWATAEKLSKFAGDMRIGGEKGGSAPGAHFAGVWNLVWGSTDDAVVNLREMVKREPLNGRALNDLAVALTEFAQHHDDPSALIDAFVAADSAVRLDSSLVEARFTHALLLEQLYLRTDAIAAWTRYLQLDGKSPWAAEARAHVAALTPRGDHSKEDRDSLRRAAMKRDSQTLTSLVTNNPSGARAVIEKELGAWGAAFSGRDSANAREHLDCARAIAGPLRAVTGDALTSDAVAAIDKALAATDVARVRTLADGHIAFARGTDPLTKSAAKDTALANARKLLARGASPMSGWALFWQARAMVTRRGSQDSALRWLTTIRDSAPTNYLALRSLAAQYQGYLYDFQSNYMHLLAAYDSALADNRTTRDPAVTLRAGSWLAQAQGVLRGREAGWRTQYTALAASPRYPTSYQPLYSVFDYAATATEDAAPRLALRYAGELLRIARVTNEPTTLAYALRRRAAYLANLGEADGARADIAAARVAAQKVPETSRPKVIADVTFADAHIALRSSPSEAEAGFRRVVDEYKDIPYEKGLTLSYAYLAQARAALGMIEPARIAFDSATSLMQRQRAGVQDFAERGAFLDAARSVIEPIVAFHADHSEKDAFEYFEGTRSRVLQEQLAQSRGQSANGHVVLQELQSRLTNDDVVLSYAVLPHELLVWTISRNRIEQRRVPVAATELEALVARFQQSLLGGSGEPDTNVSHRLYRLLVDSASGLQRGANLIVIPDRWLHFVPFVALRDPSTGRFLVRDHAVSYAPSATLLSSSLARPQRPFSRSSKVLAVGNPAFDRQAFQLPNLPAADEEARRIASLYGQTPLIGRDATDTALERMAPEFDVLHFAGHAIVGRDAPELSHLVLASDGRSDGAVFSTEIARWRLPRTQLVILSGCNTADGKLSATEGASSLARAFFAAGVPAVLSSLWAIEDEDTADFFIEFHRRLVQGDRPSVALRETQIKWLGDGSTSAHPVRSWAAFQLFGG